jgi:hypothetical protein
MSPFLRLFPFLSLTCILMSSPPLKAYLALRSSLSKFHECRIKGTVLKVQYETIPYTSNSLVFLTHTWLKTPTTVVPDFFESFEPSSKFVFICERVHSLTILRRKEGT